MRPSMCRSGFGEAMREDYFFEIREDTRQDLVFVLIIYDIVDNKKRVRFANYLSGYGNRVQKSAFEAKISRKKYDKLLREIPAYVTQEDSIRVYKITGTGQISSWGKNIDLEQDDIILI